jgi:D-alanyl-D-alanine carboxypeptidase
MNMKTARWWTLTVIGLLAGLNVAGCGNESNGANGPIAAQLQTVLDKAVADSDDNLPGAMLYISSEALGTWTCAAGMRDTENGLAMTPDNKFRAGSILKTFVSTVVLQLVEEGRLDLETPMANLLPSSIVAGITNSDTITLRMLLNHTAGIADWVTDSVQAEIASDPGRLWKTEDFLQLATAQGPMFDPGQGWSYSNTDYNILGLVIERVTGRSWREEIRERILNKLQLANTSLPEPGDRIASDEHARGYHNVDGKLIDLTEVDPSMAGAAGGHALETTAHDLARFLDALMAGDLFQNPSTLKEMLTFLDTPNEHGFPYYYGLGVDKWVFPGDVKMVGHFGGTAGFSSAVYHLPDRGITVSAALNTVDPEGLFTKILLPAIDILKEAQPGI